MRRHQLGMISIIVALTLVSSNCRKEQQATTTAGDTSGTAVSDTSMTVPPPEPVQKVEATPEAVAQAEKDSQTFAERDRRMHAILSFEEFKGTVYKEPFEGGKWIVNGDTPISDEKQLLEFYEKNVKPAQPRVVLILNTIGGLDDKWNSQLKKQITYCVSTTFGGRHADVVAQMESAAGEWEKTSDIDFVHVAAQDSSCGPGNANVMFDVRPVNVNGDYLARAFFPNEPRSARNVLIDESSFGLTPGGKLTLGGIIRHELGHTLGFRHEHTRPNSGSCFEDSDWKPLTSYDAFSVMHYPQCNGQGDWSLTLTPKDRNGVACVYGPAASFTIDAALVSDITKCAVTQPVVPPGQPKTQNFAAQSVTKNQTRQYGPFAAIAGSPMEAKIGGAGATGDPDLYVRFAAPPSVNSYDCRPFTSSAVETCALTVPANATRFFVMVRGYTAGTYDLTVTHTPPSP
ncbi:MAG TPA: matrixin family metalloprotease [Thermoanaerobaculia bacterium]|nr:matrixin family metalloprotease [Thermoanaerobaculia bacterium]